MLTFRNHHLMKKKIFGLKTYRITKQLMMKTDYLVSKTGK